MAVSKITYEDKVSTIVSPLPAINRIRDVDCNEIKDVVNDNADILQVELDQQVYSSTEVKTNKIWYDNKPIYQKTLEVDLSSEHSTNYSYIHNIANIDNIVSIDGILKRSSSNGYINVNSYSASSYRISVVGTTTTLNIQNVGYVGIAYYTIEYTKTE